MEDENTKKDTLSLFIEELYIAKCKDTLEAPSHEDFQSFAGKMKEKLDGIFVSLRNQHLGTTAASAVAKYFRTKTDLVKLDLYCNLIRDHGFQLISHMVQLNSSIRIFYIGCNDLSDKSAPYFAVMINANHLMSLQIGVIDNSIHENRFTSITVNAIAEALRKNNTLRFLGLNGGTLDILPSPSAPTPEDALIKLIAGNKGLRHLSISDCRIQSSVFISVIENGFMFNSALTRLNISRNALNYTAGTSFAQYLGGKTKKIEIEEQISDSDPQFVILQTDISPKIFYLDASYNLFNCQTAATLANVLKTSCSLGYLDLSFNEIGDEGAIDLADALSTNQSLVEIHLAGNNITSEGGIAIANALRSNQVLVHLNISKNKLGDPTAYAIAESLGVNSSLVTLNMGTTMLSNDGGIIIAEALSICKSVRYLNLCDNFFTEECGDKMEKIFTSNSTILKINVAGTQINHFSFNTLKNICNRNLALLKARKQKPVKNQYVKSKYLSVELKKKEAILKDLIEKKDSLQEEIQKLSDNIKNIKEEKEKTEKEITGQIEETRIKISTDSESHKSTKSKLENDIKSLTEKYNILKKEVEEKNSMNTMQKEIQEEKKAVLNNIIESFKQEYEGSVQELEKIHKATEKLMSLMKNTDMMASLEKMPEFLTFDNDLDLSIPPVEIPDPSTDQSTDQQTKKKTPKSSKKKTTKSKK